MASFDHLLGETPPSRVNEFIAAYESECYTCGADIFPDDEAGFLPDDSGASCAECVEEYKEGRLS